MKTATFCILLLTIRVSEAACRCNFTQLKQQLGRMYETGLTEFERVKKFIDGLETLGTTLHGEYGLLGNCGSIRSCENTILQDWAAVNLQLRSSASRSALSGLSNLSSAAGDIESKFLYYENFIGDMIRHQGDTSFIGNILARQTDFLYEFQHGQNKLRAAMATVCLVSQPISNATGRSDILRRISVDKECDAKRYLPIYMKLHSVALQYLLMLQAFVDLASQPLRANRLEFKEYTSLSNQLTEEMRQCKTDRMRTVMQTEMQLRQDFMHVGITGVIFVLCIVAVAIALAVSITRQRGRRGGRVRTRSGGCRYETGIL